MFVKFDILCYSFDMSEIKSVIASNIIYLRKEKKWTQAELAEKLNYSDKAVSKWERGESVPDIETLKNIADLFEVTVDFLLSENAPEQLETFKPKNQNKSNQLVITLLAVCMIWLVATIVYVYSQINLSYNFWTVFVWAVPISCLVLSVFNYKWGKRKLSVYINSIFIWTTLASVYLQFLSYNLWLIFFVGIPLQILTILWAGLKPKKKV